MILVTGGAGYIGSHTVRELLKNDYEVLVVDNFQTGHVEAVDERAKLARGDIRDGEFLDGVFKDHEIEAVIHFAANIEAGESMRRPLDFYDNNVHGTEVLLRAMEANGVKKIVFSSSAAVYGNSEDEFLTENSRLQPTNAYGETKLAMENMMKWCDVAYGTKYVALRYFNVAGAAADGTIGEDHQPETHLIPLILEVPRGKREAAVVFGDDYETADGTCVRDYIHVEDLAKAHSLALKYLLDGNNSNVFNLGNNNGFSVLEIIEATRAVTGDEIPLKIEGRRMGDPARLVASADKAREILGWEAQYADVKEIIASAWKWHEAHPDGY